jgi:YHS domain-containing protein
VELKSQKGKPLYENKKIKKSPVAPKVVKRKVVTKPVIVKSPPPRKAVKKPKPLATKPPSASTKGAVARLAFYGTNLSIPFDKKMKEVARSKVDKAYISEQWSKLARSDYEPMLDTLASTRKALSLNDWAYALLVKQLASEVYARKQNEQAIFIWFVLIKSGYKARLAYQGNQIYLLLPVKQQVYAAQSLSYGGQKYYVLGFDGGKQPRVGSLYTYDSEYKGSSRILDLNLPTLFEVGNQAKMRSLNFSFNKKLYQITSSSDPIMIEFMRTYPQVHWEVYFNANLSSQSRLQLLKQLRPLVNGISEEDAVNLLLRFVQKSLKYDTDDKQFGYENPLFVEETLFYPASDCEDRSVLFAWLVKELLGLDVVGLLYPGHMATAVRMNMKVSGDRVSYKGKTYYIADPTYSNANVGMAMPKFSRQKPEFIEVL